MNNADLKNLRRILFDLYFHQSEDRQTMIESFRRVMTDATLYVKIDHAQCSITLSEWTRKPNGSDLVWCHRYCAKTTPVMLLLIPAIHAVVQAVADNRPRICQ